MLKVSLGARLSGEDGSEPSGSKGAGLDVFVLSSKPDVLHEASVDGDVLEHGVDCVHAILGCNVLCRSTHLDEVLSVDFNHWVESGA